VKTPTTNIIIEKCGPPPFEPGDIVRFKGSENSIVVLWLSPCLADGYWDANCTWLDADLHKQEETIPVMALEKV
jgi:hypothetical protein